MAAQEKETVNYNINIFTDDDPNMPVVCVMSTFTAGEYMQVAVSVMDETRVKEDWDEVKRLVNKAVGEALAKGAEYALPVGATNEPES